MTNKNIHIKTPPIKNTLIFFLNKLLRKKIIKNKNEKNIIKAGALSLVKKTIISNKNKKKGTKFVYFLLKKYKEEINETLAKNPPIISSVLKGPVNLPPPTSMCVFSKPKKSFPVKC